MPRRHWTPTGAAAQPFRRSLVGHEVPAHRLRSPSLHHLGRDLFVPTSAADDPVTAARAVALVLPSGAAFSHVTAAALWQLPALPDGDPWRPLHASVPTDWQAPRRRLVAGHRTELAAEHVTTAQGLPVTTPARTFLDLGSVLDVPWLVAVGDALLRSGLCDATDLDDMVTWAVGRRGVRRARAACDLLDPGAESPRESVLRVHLVRAGLPRPEVNGWICDPAGNPRYRGDLVFRAQRVIVEYEGAHHRDPTQYAADLRRRNDLLAWGWRVVHVEAAMLRSPGTVVALVREALAQAR